MIRGCILVAAALAAAAPGLAQTPATAAMAAADPEIAELLEAPAVRRALELIVREHPVIVRDQIRINEVPAPGGAEGPRAELYARLLREAGADSVWMDEVGNVLGLRRGTVRDSVLVMSGHLDTVFHEGTDVRVRVRGDTLFAPGIQDDARGLAALLGMTRALAAEDLRTRHDLVVLATVGEEGLGDLRGVKHHFREGRGRVAAFVTVDTHDAVGVTNHGIGVRRYRVTVRGSGGHSWTAFGGANPIHALGSGIDRFVHDAAPVVDSPTRSAFNVGRVGGGTSVNSIPFEAWAEVDLRSEAHSPLLRLDSLLWAAMASAVDDHNARAGRRGAPLELELSLVGDRPTGTTAPEHPLVRRALALNAWSGVSARLSAASTDANLPMSLGIPSVVVSGGGIAGGTHSPSEWWVDRGGAQGVQRLLLLVLAQGGWERS